MRPKEDFAPGWPWCCWRAALGGQTGQARPREGETEAGWDALGARRHCSARGRSHGMGQPPGSTAQKDAGGGAAPRGDRGQPREGVTSAQRVVVTRDPLWGQREGRTRTCTAAARGPRALLLARLNGGHSSAPPLSVPPGDGAGGWGRRCRQGRMRPLRVQRAEQGRTPCLPCHGAVQDAATSSTPAHTGDPRVPSLCLVPI